MTTRILLFDIDGTLLLSGGAGARAIDTVFFDLYGLPDAFSGIVPDGKIDLGIFREIIKQKNVNVKDVEEALGILCEKYIDELKVEMPISPQAVLMPGIPDLLERLSQVPDLHMGLVTGNLEPGARIKCDRFDLNRFFPFGAFGSDHEDRAELVRIALRRAERHLGQTLSMGANVFVLGDTPKDVKCGKVNGATAVGVATNNSTVEELLSLGADYAFEDFSDVDAVVEKLLTHPVG